MHARWRSSCSDFVLLLPHAISKLVRPGASAASATSPSATFLAAFLLMRDFMRAHSGARRLRRGSEAQLCGSTASEASPKGWGVGTHADMVRAALGDLALPLKDA